MNSPKFATQKYYCLKGNDIMHKAVANGAVGQVLAGTLLLNVKTEFHFTKSK